MGSVVASGGGVTGFAGAVGVCVDGCVGTCCVGPIGNAAGVDAGVFGAAGWAVAVCWVVGSGAICKGEYVAIG
jgi:hypothetical protein